MHWKLFFGFVLLPILFLGFFVVSILLIRNEGEPIPSAINVFGVLFGTFGFGILMVVILRAKRLFIAKNSLEIVRLFTLKKYSYKKTDILQYSIEKKGDASIYSFFTVNHYELIQIKTIDGKYHHIISYETKNFDSLSKWLKSSSGDFTHLSELKMIETEYLLPFIIGFIITVLIFGII